MIGRFEFALCFALFAVVCTPGMAQRQFALTDKVGQGNFAYNQPGLYYGEEPKPYRLFAKRAQRFAYENDSPLSGKFAKMIPNNRRDFAFAFAKRTQ